MKQTRGITADDHLGRCKIDVVYSLCDLVYQEAIMIWGRTTKENEAAKPKIGDERIRFMWYPDQLPNGRWCWWCWVKQKFDGYTYLGDSGQKWPIVEVVAGPEK